MCETAITQGAEQALQGHLGGIRMHARPLTTAAIALTLAGAASALAAPPPPLAAEHLVVAQMPASNAHRVYVFDTAEDHENDYRIHVFDGDSAKLLGQIDMGYYPEFALSPDGKTSAVATTYWSRGWHGTHTDVVEFTDNATLAFTREVVLKTQHMQGPPTAFNLTYSSDQKFLYVANITPAASVSVIDVAQGTVAGEIETDGCALAIASGARRVAALCESGRLLTVTVDEMGHEASRSLSKPFFDAGKDPIFVQGLAAGSRLLFVSFLGDVYSADLGGAEPSFAPTWSLVTAQERGTWRTGGAQPFAYQAHLARLYVPMHKGVEGSHKLGGSEIWVFDTDTHKRLARWPVDTHRFGSVVAIAASRDEKPLLYATTDSADLLVMDPASGKILRMAKNKVGQTPWFLVTP